MKRTSLAYNVCITCETLPSKEIVGAKKVRKEIE